MAEGSDSVVSNNVNIQKQSSLVPHVNPSEENKTEKVLMEVPILLDDYRPGEAQLQTVKNLFSYFETVGIIPATTDILSGLIYILLLESGFVPCEHKHTYEDYNFSYRRLLNLSKKLPTNSLMGQINSVGLYYSFSMVLPPFDEDVCTVACISSSSDLIVNCVVNSLCFSIVLDPLSYVISSRTQVVGMDKLQSLERLSKLVKDEICEPARHAVFKKHGARFSCFEHLPPEIMTKIFSYLHRRDLDKLMEVNSRICAVLTTRKKR